MDRDFRSDLRSFVATVVEPLCAARADDLSLEVDIPTRLECPPNRDMFATLLRQLVLESLGSMPSGGEITITACQSGSMIELEIADTREMQQALRSLPLAARQMGAELTWYACPQGGNAVTIRWNKQYRAGRRAA